MSVCWFPSKGLILGEMFGWLINVERNRISTLHWNLKRDISLGRRNSDKEICHFDTHPQSRTDSPLHLLLLFSFSDTHTRAHTQSNSVRDRQEAGEEFPSGHFSRSFGDWKHTLVKWRQDIISRWGEKGCNLFPFPSSSSLPRHKQYPPWYYPFIHTHSYRPTHNHTQHLLSPGGGQSLADQHGHTMAVSVAEREQVSR